MTTQTETICAIATPPGKGGVGIVRISGPLVPALIQQLFNKELPSRHAQFVLFNNEENELLDEGLALYFPAPNSFTGEHVLEFQGHGSPVVLNLIIETLNRRGVRLARPGEFSERAFLNDKIDLAQAEAIADLIDSASTQSARAAMRSLQGEFSRHVNELVSTMIDIRMFVESAIDFPEEEIDFLAESDVMDRLDRLKQKFQSLQSKATQGKLLRDGMTVVLAGKPNAGKSSLLNALSGEETAIVTDVPGTTRDIVKEHIQIDGMPLHIIDTAGLRETMDSIEKIGVERAQKAIASADVVLLITDCQERVPDETLLAQMPATLPVIHVMNKVDLLNEETLPTYDQDGFVYLSAKTGKGIDQLKSRLKTFVGFEQSSDSQFIARRRHLDALERAMNHLQQGIDVMIASRAGELLAEELRQGQEALNEITGEYTADDLLGKIFSSFCIGK